MVRTVLLLTALACSKAVAFVMPLAPRAAVGGVGTRDRLAAARQPPPAMRRAGTSDDGADDAAPVHMRYVAMNRFKVKLGCEDDFENMWRERESKLSSFSGFEQFMLLKVDNGDQDGEEPGASRAGHTEFISHTVWAHQIDYEDWRESQAFKKSHGGGSEGEKPSFVSAGGMSKIGDLIVGRPTPVLFNAVIIEPVPPEHQGGLWDFENEPSYFDGDM